MVFVVVHADDFVAIASELTGEVGAEGAEADDTKAHGEGRIGVKLGEDDFFRWRLDGAFAQGGGEGGDDGDESDPADEHVEDQKGFGALGQVTGEVHTKADGGEGADQLEHQSGVGDMGLQLTEEGEVDKQPSHGEDKDGEGFGADGFGESAAEEDEVGGAANDIEEMDGSDGKDGGADAACGASW